MFSRLLTLLCSLIIAEGKHFNGGTINWAPINPYNNSTTIPITITQSYSWTYPYISCANNVPASTPGWSGANRNLTCVVDCTSDGGYSTHPIDILTDCTSASTPLSMLSSTKAKNLTLNAGAHFYLAYLGTAWVALNYPTQSGLEWSIVTFIDLRMRPDGFINTPPVANAVPPQYVFVNQTVQINIPVSDANAGDDVRCRWSKYTTGYRRRKRSSEKEYSDGVEGAHIHNYEVADNENVYVRKKRTSCTPDCKQNDPCTDTGCQGTTCTSTKCTVTCCGYTAATTIATTETTTTTTDTTTTTATTTTDTTTTTTTTDTTTTTTDTTTETLGTLKSTSTYPVRQAINECGGICYPGGVPNGTTLSNCTINFTGSRAGVWYAVAVQVEDFINSTSTTPMSSVPVQFLIYVLPLPACPKAPLILPINGCLEVQVGVSVNFRLYAMNLCNRTVANLTDIIISNGITGMSVSNLINLPTNLSLSYIILTWTPQANQVGFQELCAIAFTSEKVQSNESCEIFTVKNSSDVCVTTTTTSTSTTTSSTTSTSQTTTTTSSTTTSETTSTTTETTTTSTTSSTTSSSTSSSSTSTSTTSTTTSTTSSSTSTSSTSTSTTSTTTSTTSSSTSSSSTSTSTTSTTTSTTTSSTSTTSTTTSTTSTSTSATTTSVTTTTATTATTTIRKTTKKSIHWLLILGLSLLALLLAICCACCCLYWFLWYPAARRRRRRKSDDDMEHQTVMWRPIENLTRTRQPFTRLYQSSSLNNESLGNNTLRSGYSIVGGPPTDLHLGLSEPATVPSNIKGNRIPSAISVKRVTQSEIANMTNIQKPTGTRNTDINSANDVDSKRNSSVVSHLPVNVVRVKRVSTMITMQPETLNAVSTTPKQTGRITVAKLPRSKSCKIQRPRAASMGNVSVIRLDQSSMEMQPIGNRTRGSIAISERQANTNNGVTVIKLPRGIATTQSYYT